MCMYQYNGLLSNVKINGQLMHVTTQSQHNGSKMKKAEKYMHRINPFIANSRAQAMTEIRSIVAWEQEVAGQRHHKKV